MTANTNFFTSQQPAAVFKLKVLEDYLTAWAMKVASKAPREVAYVDGYAGAGQYDDAHKGSPLYAVDIARKLAAQNSIMHIHLVERDRAHAETLRRAVAAQGQGAGPVYLHHGAVEEQIDAILNDIGTRPALFFLDPFGTALPYDVVASKLLLRPARSTEVLLNFSLSTVWRIGGIVRKGASASSGETVTLLRGDRFLGGPWWREVFAEARRQADVSGDSSSAATAASYVAREYMQRMTGQTAHNVISVPIRRTPSEGPIFTLMLFYQHFAAPMLFADAAARAHRKWRQVNSENYYQGLLDDTQGSLFDLQETFDQQVVAEQTDVRNRAIAAIQTRLSSHLGQGQAVRICDDVPHWLGEHLGTAGASEVRQAIKNLQKAGIAQGYTKDMVEGRAVILPARRGR